MTDFDVKLPYHGDLLKLQEDGFNFYWTEDYKAQFKALQVAIGIPFPTWEEPLENTVRENTSIVLHDCEAKALDPRWLTSKDSGSWTALQTGGEQPSGWDYVPDLEPSRWNCMPNRKQEDENMVDFFR
jgi:hypothetical protein